MAVDSFAQQLAAIHGIAALFTKTPELAISQQESEKLAAAIKAVLVYHQVTISPQVLAYSQLVGVSAAIYIPRAGIILMKNKAAREARKQQEVFSQAGTTANSNAPETDKDSITQPTDGKIIYQ